MPELRVSSPESYVTLALVPGIGSVRLAALLDAFGSAERVLRARSAELTRVAGIPQVIADSIRRHDPDSGRRAMARIEAVGGALLVPEDDRYPDMLRTIPDPPPLLFALGRLELLRRPAVAIVGSRDHSRYGEEVTRALARAAARAGLAVVSGMARGLDAVAHLGALDGGGATIGVLGNGFGVVYPESNRILYQRVADSGLLVSELCPGERPNRGSFSRRNRLISGLARVTVVVEAAEPSGTMGTVNYAQAQGRDVLAVPGPITSPVSAGTNALLRDGAGPLLELRDLLHHYPEASAPDSTPPSPAESQSDRLLQALRKEPLSTEALVEQTGLAADAALQALSLLELRGRIRQEAGRYHPVRDSLFG